MIKNKHPSTSNHCESNSLHSSVRPQTLGEEDYQDHQESSNSSGGPCHLKWRTCFEALMEDGDGIELFRKYLDREQQSDLLDFYLACNGFRNVYPKKDDAKLAKVFYKKFIRSDKIILSKATKKEVIDKMKTKSADRNMYDKAQNEVMVKLKSHYLHFIRSDIFESFAKEELEKTSHGSQTESPNRRKDRGSDITELECVRFLKGNNTAATDISCSFSTFSFLSADDKNQSRVEPLGVRSQISGREIKARSSEDTMRPQQPLANVTTTTDKEEESARHHVSMVTASLIDSSSRSFTSDPVNTQDEFTSSSRDERDVVRSRGQWGQHGSRKFANYNNNEMNLIVQPREFRRVACNLAQDNPQSFFRQVEERLLELLEQNKIEKERQPPPSTTCNTNNNASNNDYNLSSCLRNKTMSIHPTTSDNDHLRALDTSLTRLDEGAPRRGRDFHPNVTLPVHPSGFETRQFQGHPPMAGMFKHPYDMHWDISLLCGQTPCRGPSDRSFHNQYNQYDRFPNRSFVQPNNKSLNISNYMNQSQEGQSHPYLMSNPYGNDHDNRYYQPKQHQRHLAGHSVHPSMVQFAQRINNTQNFNKVLAWMESDGYHEETKGSCGASENSMKRSTRTCNTEGTKRASGSHQGRQSHVSESHQSFNQSVHQHDVSRCPINSTSASNSTTASANTVVATNGMHSAVPLANQLTGLAQPHRQPMPQFHQSSVAPSLQSVAAPQKHPSPNVTIVRYCHVGDVIPTRTTIPAIGITFGRLKQHLKKKGKFRYCFKKLCPDFGDGPVYEEVVDDDQILPLWQGMIHCKIDAINSSDDEDAGS